MATDTENFHFKENETVKNICKTFINIELLITSWFQSGLCHTQEQGNHRV